MKLFASQILTICRFQWTKCQLHYLQILPNDHERRAALREKMPPDLHSLYIAIFERIDKMYPDKTKLYIRRALVWLTLSGLTVAWLPCEIRTFTKELSLSGLAQAISVDNDMRNMPSDIVPNDPDILKWCGCLVKLQKNTGFLKFSHFTVKEFLLSSPEYVLSDIAKNYLVHPRESKIFCAETCASSLALQNNEKFSTCSMDIVQIREFKARYPFSITATFAVFNFIKATVIEEIQNNTSSPMNHLTPKLRSLVLNESDGCARFWRQYLYQSKGVRLVKGDIQQSPRGCTSPNCCERP